VRLTGVVRTYVIWKRKWAERNLNIACILGRKEDIESVRVCIMHCSSMIINAYCKTRDIVMLFLSSLAEPERIRKQGSHKHPRILGSDETLHSRDVLQEICTSQSVYPTRVYRYTTTLSIPPHPSKVELLPHHLLRHLPQLFSSSRIRSPRLERAHNVAVLQVAAVIFYCFVSLSPAQNSHPASRRRYFKALTGDGRIECSYEMRSTSSLRVLESQLPVFEALYLVLRFWIRKCS